MEKFSPALAPIARAFLDELRAAIKAGDKQHVAKLVRFPLNVNALKGHRAIPNKAELLKQYDAVFTSSVKKAIEQQVPACLFANYQGVMIGDGEVWFEEQQDKTMKIKTVNLDQ